MKGALRVEEELFDLGDMPSDANGFAMWQTVWIKDRGDIGAIEAAHGNEYDVMTGGKLVRVSKDQIKGLSDLTSAESEQLAKLAS